MPDIIGFSHLTLTVSDVDRSGRWWTDLLGIQKLFDGENQGIPWSVFMHPGTGLILGFRQGSGPESDRFAEDRIGLDHAALQVGNRAELEEWEKRLDEQGIDHSEIKDMDYGHILTFRDPDNIQMEFFALPEGMAG
jgi:catechol 2,3-dioxygenase-like lactoylglutathione lyase family enzyme